MLILPETVHNNKLVESPDPPSRWPNSCRIVCKEIAGQMFGTLLFTWNQLGFMDAPMFIPPSYGISYLNWLLRGWRPTNSPARIEVRQRVHTRNTQGVQQNGHVVDTSKAKSPGPLWRSYLAYVPSNVFAFQPLLQASGKSNVIKISTPVQLPKLSILCWKKVKTMTSDKAYNSPTHQLIDSSSNPRYRHRLYQGAMAMRQGPRCVPRCFEPLSGDPTWQKSTCHWWFSPFNLVFSIAQLVELPRSHVFSHTKDKKLQGVSHARVSSHVSQCLPRHRRCWAGFPKSCWTPLAMTDYGTKRNTFCTGLSYIEIYLYTLAASLSRAAGFEEIPRMADWWVSVKTLEPWWFHTKIACALQNSWTFIPPWINRPIWVASTILQQNKHELQVLFKKWI